MNNSTRTVILTLLGIAVIMLVIGVAIGSVAFPTTKTETTTTIQLSTVTATSPTTMTSILVSEISSLSTSSNSNISTTCVIAAEGNLIFTLQNSSNGNPLGSVPIQVTEVAPLCASTYTTTTMSPLSTNASGIILVCCDIGQYYFALSHSGIHYNVNASIEPERATCVTLGIPSGKVNITYSQTFQNVC